jgi:hypothetical protein
MRTLTPLTAFLFAALTAVASVAAEENQSASYVDDSVEYSHFVAHLSNQTCSSDSHARPFNNQIRGVNLGGWMVLEPWITPSLFYQFLGGDETNTAFDTYTFCKVLGAEEANRQLRRHWETWVTEDIIKELASSDAVNSLRLPVGDYMYKPYGPYSKSRACICMDNRHQPYLDYSTFPCTSKLILSPELCTLSSL